MALCLHNPRAGHGARQHLERLEELLGEAVKLVDLTHIADVQQYVNGLDKKVKVVLAGGDGTLNHFVNAVDCDHLEHEILYYPAGSGNDFAKDVGYEKGCSPFVLNPYLRDLPYVTVQGKTMRFLNGIGFGIDGYCCEEGDRLRAKSDKPVNYTAIAIKGLLFHFRPRNAVVTIDGVTREFKKVWLAPTMHGRYFGGGMMVTPKQQRLHTGGKVTTMLLSDIGKLHILSLFPTIFKGEHVKFTKYIRFFRGEHIHVQFDEPCALQVDGETFLNVYEYSVRTRRDVGDEENALFFSERRKAAKEELGWVSANL